MILVRDIQRATAEHYGIPLETMSVADGLGNRLRKHAHPRQVAMLISRRMTRKAWTQLGRIFHRDHSTIIAGTRAARRRCLADRKHLLAVCEIRAKLMEAAG